MYRLFGRSDQNLLRTDVDRNMKLRYAEVTL